MAVRLLVGPVGSGKTGRALSIFKEFSPAEHLHSVRFIVPSLSRVIEIRRILLEDPEFPGLLGDPVCTFHGFARELLLRAKERPPKPISDIQRHIFLREVAGYAPAGYFDSVRESPGFPDALGDCIDLLKRSGIAPADLRRAVELSGRRLPESSRRKILDLSALYESYQSDILAANGLCDYEDLMSRALESIRSDPRPLEAFNCIIIDGFPAMNPAQQELVRLLCDHCDRVIAVVDYEPGRPGAFSHVERTVRFLTELPNAGVERIPSREDCREPALHHLEKHLFVPNPPQAEPEESITVLAGATRAMEIELVAMEIKKLARERGLRFGEFAVAARSIEPYRDRVASAFREHGIPVAAQEYSFSGSVLARAVLLSLQVVLDGWRLEHVLALLKSPYMQCDIETCCRLEEGASVWAGEGGRDAWLNPWHPGDETLETRRSALSPVAAFGDMLTSQGAGCLREAVGRLIGRFHMRADEEGVYEDHAAWRSIRRILDDIAAGEQALGRSFESRELLDLLEAGIRAGMYLAGNADGVFLGDVGDLAGRKFSVVFIVGMLERAFPRQVREDHFLRDLEREALNLHLLYALELQAAGLDYEQFLFYAAASSARERLYLCYPAARQNGPDWDALPSCYINEVDALFAGKVRRITRDLREVVPPIEQAETPKALVAGTVLECCTAGDEAGRGVAAAAYNMLIDAGLLSHSAFEWLQEREVGPSDPLILTYLEHAPVYRVSEAETYGACPFRRFCEHELKLGTVEEEPGASEGGAVPVRPAYCAPYCGFQSICRIDPWKIPFIDE